MRILSLVTIVLGIAALALGVVFVFQANAGNNEITTSILPLTADQVNPKYDAVSAKYNQIMAAEEPSIQAGKAAPFSGRALHPARKAPSPFPKPPPSAKAPPKIILTTTE